MLRLTSDEFLRRMRRAVRIEPTPVVVVTPVPRGPTVSLDDYRKEMETRRVPLVGKPGVWLDRSPTGAGKSQVDLKAFRRAGRSLSVQPTHENCSEVVKACCEANIDAMAYPGRCSEGSYQNCWNPDADVAESLGLSVVRAVCRVNCERRRDCLERGYLGQVAEANKARVVVVTHARIIHSGFASLTEGREFVSVHEDAMDTLVTQMSMRAVKLESARFVLNWLLNDPVWLDRFGPEYAMEMNDELEVTFVVAKTPTERRNALYEFLIHLADVVDELRMAVGSAESVAEISVGRVMQEPSGVQAILFRICRELGVYFGGEPVWRLLLAIATGEFFRMGVLVDDECGENNPG